MTASEITFVAADGASVPALLALPDAAGRAAPGVVLAHGEPGLDAHARDVARRFAEAGYACIAPDLFARGGAAGAEPSWAALSDRVAVRDLDAAVAWLGAREGVDAERVAAVGLGGGGTLAFLLGCRSDRASAVVDVGGPLAYPALSAAKPSQPLELALNLACPLLALVGADDPATPPGEVELARRVLSQFAKHFDIVAYPAAGPPILDVRRSDAAADAWERILGFLRSCHE